MPEVGREQQGRAVSQLLQYLPASDGGRFAVVAENRGVLRAVNLHHGVQQVAGKQPGRTVLAQFQHRVAGRMPRRQPQPDPVLDLVTVFDALQQAGFDQGLDIVFEQPLFGPIS